MTCRSIDNVIMAFGTSTGDDGIPFVIAFDGNGIERSAPGTLTQIDAQAGRPGGRLAMFDRRVEIADIFQCSV